MTKTPYILNERYPTNDLSVITAAVNYSGEEDATPIIQAAIDETAAIGGGTVYLPEGQYPLRTTLVMKTGVCLRGEWINPDVEPNNGRGTILLCYAGENDPDGPPQIGMQACTGLRNLTCFYPNQSVAAPVPYSPTVRQPGGDSITLENVTLVNPWRGVQCGPEGNELHTLKNVYMTPVSTGMFMDVTTDIGRLQNLQIKPQIWENFTLNAGDPVMTAEESTALRAHMLRGVTGVFMARSDWEYGYNIYVEHCHIGFLITSFTSGGPNAQISRLRLHNCCIGFHLINVNAYGVALSDSKITADIPGLRAAIVSDNKFRTVMQLNMVELAGCYPRLIEHDGSGLLSFVNCTLSGWSEEAVLQKQGGLTMMQCDFGAGATHFVLEESVGGTQILGCQFETPCQIEAGDIAKAQLQFSDEPLNLSKAPTKGHPFIPYPQPGSPTLYLAADYGAAPVQVPRIRDGGGRNIDEATARAERAKAAAEIETAWADAVDNTAAIQAALDAAGKTGGIVYLSGGWYRCDGNLHIPAGVELRGVYETPCHTMGGGSVLRTYTGKGDEDAAPFITLAAGAGLRGVVIQHPEQHPAEPVAFPWAVQSRGTRCWVIDVVFVNAWLGLDSGTYPSEGHYISYISGAPLKCGVFVGNCSGEGWIENVQYNPHYWSRSNFPGRAEGRSWRAFWLNQIKYLDALKFGCCADEHLLGTFVFAAKHGLHFVLQDGKGARGTFIGHGTDGGEIGLCIEGLDEVDLINTELVTLQSPLTRSYFLVKESAAGKARVYNTLMWGQTHLAMLLHGGDIEYQQLNIVDPGDTAITVTGGRHDINGVYFYRNSGNFNVSGGNVTATGCMTPRRGANRADPLSSREPVLDNVHSGGEFAERFSWSK